MTNSKVSESNENSQTVVELILELKESSGLNDKQIGELIGVSAMAIHTWISGFEISEKHKSRVEEIHEVLFELPVRGVKARKNMILDFTTGDSMFKTLVAQTKN